MWEERGKTWGQTVVTDRSTLPAFLHMAGGMRGWWFDCQQNCHPENADPITDDGVSAGSRHSCGFMPWSQFRHNRHIASHFSSGVTSECQRYQQGINPSAISELHNQKMKSSAAIWLDLIRSSPTMIFLRQIIESRASSNLWSALKSGVGVGNLGSISGVGSKDIASHVTFLFIKPRSINPQFKARPQDVAFARSHVLSHRSLSGHLLSTSNVWGSHLNCHMFWFFKYRLSPNVSHFTCDKPLHSSDSLMMSLEFSLGSVQMPIVITCNTLV